MTCARNKIYVYKSNFPKAIEAILSFSMFFICRLFSSSLESSPVSLLPAFWATEIVIDIVYHAYTIFCVAIIHATIFVFIHVCRKMPENFQLDCVCFFHFARSFIHYNNCCCPSFSASIVHNFPFIWNRST